ncbi:hypothetical protein D3C84_701570 [compost metagenome]
MERRNQLPEGLEQWLNKIAPPDPGRRKPALTRFNENGSPDLVFGNKILPGTDTIVGLSGCLQADAKILLLVSSSVKAGDKKPFFIVCCLMVISILSLVDKDSSTSASTISYLKVKPWPSVPMVKFWWVVMSSERILTN